MDTGFSSFSNIGGVMRAISGVAARVGEVAEEARAEVEAALARREGGDLSAARVEAAELAVGRGDGGEADEGLSVKNSTLVTRGAGRDVVTEYYGFSHPCVGRRDIGCVIYWEHRLYALVWRQNEGGSFADSVPSVWRIPPDHGCGVVGMTLGTSHGAIATQRHLYVWGDIPGAGNFGPPNNPRCFDLRDYDGHRTYIKQLASSPDALFVLAKENIYAIGADVRRFFSAEDDDAPPDKLFKMVDQCGEEPLVVAGCKTTMVASFGHLVIADSFKIFSARWDDSGTSCQTSGGGQINIEHISCGEEFRCMWARGCRPTMHKLNKPIPCVQGRFLGRVWSGSEDVAKEIGAYEKFDEAFSSRRKDGRICSWREVDVRCGTDSIALFSADEILHVSPAYDGHLKIYRFPDKWAIHDVRVREHDLVVFSQFYIYVWPLGAESPYKLLPITLNAPSITVNAPMDVRATLYANRIEMDGESLMDIIEGLKEEIAGLKEEIQELRDDMP